MGEDSKVNEKVNIGQDGEKIITGEKIRNIKLNERDKEKVATAGGKHKENDSNKNVNDTESSGDSTKGNSSKAGNNEEIGVNDSESGGIEEDNKDEDGEDKNEDEDDKDKDDEDKDKDDEDKDKEDEVNKDEDEDNDDKDEDEDDEETNQKDNSPDENDESPEINKRDRNLNPSRRDTGVDDESKGMPKTPNENEYKDGSIGDVASRAGSKIAGSKLGSKAMRAKNSIVRKAKNIKLVSDFSISMLFNPLFWISLLLILVIMVIISFSSTLGKNDFNDVCSSEGVGGLNIPTDADEFTRQSGIASWLTANPFEALGNKPMSREQAMGVMGNLIQESYGANPFTIQGSHPDVSEAWRSCDNSCVLEWGDVGGKAIGIVQWDTLRRVEMVNFAKDQGTEWYDLETQLLFLKKELDGGEGKGLAKGGFNNPTNSVRDYAYIWNKYFERSGDSKYRSSEINQKREANAEEFSQKYSGGGSIAGAGLATQCAGSSAGIDATNLVSLATSISHPDKKDARLSPLCSTLTNCGKNLALPGYIEAKNIAEQKGGKDPQPGLFASCDRFVATVVKATGTDINFPWGATGQQIAHMRAPANGWKEVGCQDRQPGDVLWKENHIMLYIGMFEGKDSIASASIGTKSGGRVASISGMHCNGSKYYADGADAIGFRKVN